MYEFTYHQAKSTEQALSLLSDSEDGKLMAGGMTLLPTMKQRLAQPSDLIDISNIEQLRGIERVDDGLRIGAMTPHVVVARSELVRETIPTLADLAAHIGDPAVRNRGTLGGSIANADPAADYPAAVVALNATVHTSAREIAADDFFTDIFETALEEQELVTGVTFRVPDKAHYMKFPNPASRYAIVGVMVAVFGQHVRVAVTGAGASVFRIPAMESALAERFDPQVIEAIQYPDDELNSDIHASAEYRAHLINVMARRAVTAAG